MLAIRFNRTGKKNRAYFRVAVQEHTKAPGKRHVEIVGSYDPHKKTTILKKDRILYWIGNGAQVSPAVHNMLVREGVIEGKKIAKKMPRPVVKESVEAEAAPAVAEAVADKEVKVEEASATVETTPVTEASAEGETKPAESEAVPAAEAIPTPETPVSEPVAEAIAAEVAPEKAEAMSVEEKKEEAPVKAEAEPKV